MVARKMKAKCLLWVPQKTLRHELRLECFTRKGSGEVGSESEVRLTRL